MSKVSAKGALFTAGLSMGTLGIITAGIGPSLPNLAANNSSSLANIGALFSAMYIGSIGAQLFGGFFNDRYGQRAVMLFGLVIMALGSAGMVSSSMLWLTLACAAFSGIGRGALSITSHLLVARVFAERSAPAFNMLNVFYGVGAIVSPFIASYTLSQWDTALPVIWLGVAMLFLQIPVMLRLDGKLPGVIRQGEAQTVRFNPLSDPLLWICGIIALVYVGAEVGYGGWITTYLERSLPINTAVAAQMTSALWVAMTVGRIIAATIGTRISASQLLLGCSLGIAITMQIFLSAAGNVTLTMGSIIVLGLLFGPMYPTLIAITNQSFKKSPSTATSIASAMGSIGATILPWLQGNVMEYQGPSASMLMVSVSLWVIVALNLLRMFLTKRRLEAEESAS